MGVLIKLDKDELALQTEPSIEKLFFWERWTYTMNVPVKKIKEIKLKRICGVPTAHIVVDGAEGDQQIPFCLLRANRSELHLLSQLTHSSQISNYYHLLKFMRSKDEKKMSDWGANKLKSA